MMLKALSRFLFGTLRGRLIVGVAVVHALMMTLFIADLTARQRTMLLDRQIEEATALSLALATSAAGWIAADDVSGLQELVEVQRRYPELLFAILADTEGRVLADTDKSRQGKYLLDLPRETRQTVLSGAPSLADVAAPAMIGGRHVGWARVGIGQKAAGEKLAQITRSGVGYALAAIVIGSVIAWFMGNRITRRLYVVQKTIDAVRSGNRLARSPCIGTDEAAVMAREFNAMLDALAERDAELRESEELHRLTLSSISDALFVTDDAGALKYICPNVAIIFGHSFEEVQAIGNIHELLGREIFSPSELDALGELKNIERDIADKHGNTHSLLVNVKKIAILGGTRLYTCRDVTERKQADDKIRRLNERFSLATDAARLGVWDWDLQKDELVWDDRMYALYGVGKDAFGGAYEAWLKGIHPDDRAPSDQISRLARRGEREYDTEFRVVWPDGSVHYLKAYGQVIRDADGRPARMTGINFDITARKRAEKEIHKLNQELEQRVAERTAQLESANKELEAFAYSVSHDLRAPLRHIDGFLGLLKDEIGAALNDESRHYVAAISRAAKRMDTLIDDLLSFSRMGRFEMVKTQVDLAALVREVVRDFDPETHGRVVHWDIAELPVVAGDRAMLRVVLSNLISNALKFTQQRATAEIAIGCQPGGAAETIVFVRDNGAGFDMNYADKLFGVFQRLHGVDEFEGTGIGLANVRRVIQRHGGRTWAAGEVDAGATFYFSLPRAAAADSSQHPALADIA